MYDSLVLKFGFKIKKTVKIKKLTFVTKNENQNKIKN